MIENKPTEFLRTLALLTESNPCFSLCKAEKSDKMLGGNHIIFNEYKK
jgi:hypothetical protein